MIKKTRKLGKFISQFDNISNTENETNRFLTVFIGYTFLLTFTIEE